MDPIYGLYFGHNIKLNNKPSASHPRAAVSDNYIYVVWTDNNSSQGNGEINFRRSSDNGASFQAAENLSNNLGNSTNAIVAAHKNNVYVIWTDDTIGNTDIYFRKSSDYGNNFNRTINLSSNNGSSLSPQLAVSDNHVYIVWSDDTRGNNDIDLKASHDYGNTFNRTRPISRTNASSLSPQLAVSDNHVYIVWTEAISQDSSDVYFRKSSDNATTLEGAKNISEDFSPSSDPEMEVLGNDKLYITWTNVSNDKSKISFEASGDGGEHFDNPLSLSTPLPGHFSHSSHIITSVNNIYAVWVEDGPYAKGDIFFKRISETFFPRNNR
jgi:hypothetical protein